MDERSAGMRMCREVYGSALRLGITMRPVLSLESGFVTIMGVVDLMLRLTRGDAGFSLEIERVLLLRRQGEVCVREDFRAPHDRAGSRAHQRALSIRGAEAMTLIPVANGP